jgi:hypothetical protein
MTHSADLLASVGAGEGIHILSLASRMLKMEDKRARAAAPLGRTSKPALDERLAATKNEALGRY